MKTTKFCEGIVLCAIVCIFVHVLRKQTEIIEVLKTGFVMIGMILFYKFLLEIWVEK